MATLVDSWGGNGSNVYVSHTAADSYITSAIYDASAWTAATTAQQQAALLEATIDIDRINFVGTRYFPDQSLAMPRAFSQGRYSAWTQIGTPDGVLQAQMKSDVERACCHQALFICRNAGRNEHAERIQQGISAVSEGIGPVKEFTQYGAAGKGISKAQILDQKTLDLLARWREGPRVWRA